MAHSFRYRLSLAERAFWLMLALMLSLAISGHAQTRKAGHSARSPRVLRTTDGDDFVRNHGTGLRLGSELASARSGHFGAAMEIGAFHQHSLGEVGSVQVEALYFRQPATATEAATRGLRLPVLLVLNPFDNVSVHLGPQLRWQTAAASASEAGLRSVDALTTEFVVGAEARLYRARVGARYGAPISLLTDLPVYGDRFASAWRAGQVQLYLGFNVFDR